MSGVHALFEAEARAHPERACIECEGRTLSYAQVAHYAEALAALLEAHPALAPPGDERVVGLLCEPSAEAIIAILALWKLGMAYLALDPKAPVSRTTMLLERARAPLVLSTGTAARLGQDTPPQLVVDLDSLHPTVPRARESFPDHRLAYVLFTSGSTGQPKGVMVEHRQILNCIAWMQSDFPLATDATVVHRTPLTFDPSVWEMFWPLSVGGKARVIPAGKGGNVAYLAKLLSTDTSLSTMYVPASMLSAMSRALSDTRLRLPLLFIGAEPISRSAIDTFYRQFDGRIVNTYGPTECTINNTFHAIAREPARTPVPIGKAVRGNCIYIVGAAGQRLADGETGEIWIGGDSVARGYLHDPDKTAEKFVSDPFAPGRLYKTGDLARVAEDGEIEIFGRIDDQVKIRGLRIEPGEVEIAMCEHPSVAECVVVARQHPSKGNELVAYFTQLAPVGEMDLRTHLSQRLTAASIPSRFIVVNAFTLTAHGKIDRRSLPPVP